MPKALTQQLRMELGFALFLVHGGVHRRSGDPTSPVHLFGETARNFVPVANAAITYLPNDRFNTEEAVILVNTRHLDFWAVPGTT